MTTTRRVFIRNLGLTGMGALSVAALPHSLFAQPADRFVFPRSEPETQRITSAGIEQFVVALDKSGIDMHSLMIVRSGKVVAEGWWAPYAPQYRHSMYSLSKSFVSTAVGIAVKEGLLSIDAPVVSFFPELAPKRPDKKLAAMQVRHLLTMSTGHESDVMQAMRDGKTPWAQTFLEAPVKHEPGTKFLYESAATFMLSAIVQRKAGTKVSEYLRLKLFEPLGIQGFDWEESPDGITIGAYGLRITTEDIARLGQFYLLNGLWDGKQILPVDWVRDATRSQIANAPESSSVPVAENDWAQGYGYQFWQCTHEAYRGDGAYGQFCIVVPKKQLVIAMTAEAFNMQRVLNLVWQHLVPAVLDYNIYPDIGSLQSLNKRLKSLQTSVPAAGTPSEKTWNGKTIVFDTNALAIEKLRMNMTGDAVLITITAKGMQHEIFAGIDRWLAIDDFSTHRLFQLPTAADLKTPLAARLVWNKSGGFELVLRYVETAHSDYLTFTAEGGTVHVSFLNSITRGNPQQPEKRVAITGRLT